jgi:hypothetical protein
MYERPHIKYTFSAVCYLLFITTSIPPSIYHVPHIKYTILAV